MPTYFAWLQSHSPVQLLTVLRCRGEAPPADLDCTPEQVVGRLMRRPSLSDASLLLDGAADREGTGRALRWPFCIGSLRRVLDQGVDADTLIARRHGELRLSAQGKHLRAADPTRLAEATKDRTPTKLGLRRLAPTILSTKAPLGVTLPALREAGSFPLEEGEPAGWTDDWTGPEPLVG